MKDLIAKLQLDASCALGAIWMHIDAQAARIAELEAENTNLRYELNAALSGGTVSCPSASTALQAPVREVPEGWEFNGADFSLKAAGKSNKGHISLIRDLEGRAAWHALDDEGKDSTALYLYGEGETLRDAIADAVKHIPAAPVQEEPKP